MQKQRRNERDCKKEECKRDEEMERVRCTVWERYEDEMERVGGGE